MLCNKCANIFDDSLPFCPECGTAAQADDKKSSNKGFTVNISDESFDALDEQFIITDEDISDETSLDSSEDLDTGDSDTDEEKALSSDDSEKADESDSTDEDITDEVTADEGTTDEGATDDDTAKADAETDTVEKADADDQKAQVTEKKLQTQEDKKIVKKAETPPVKKAVQSKKKVAKSKETKQEKNASNFIVCLVCVLGAVLIALCAIGFTTDVFKKDDGVKAVALLGLTSEEEKSLEAHLAAVSSLAEKGFDSSKTTAEEFLSNIYPGDENGMFKKLGKSAVLVTDEADPALRFGVEDSYEGEKQYSYYKAEKWQVDSILEAFGINVNDTLNTERAYYYDGYYYFSSQPDESSAQSTLGFEITESKRIQDGGYYAECTVLNSIDTKVTTVYVIAEKVIGENEERSWKITRIQSEPIFDSLGIMIDASGSEQYGYEMKTLTFDALTDDEELFCKYTFEYPVFKGDSNGEKAANALYDSIISSYKAQSENAQKDYEKFKKDGYDESCLPLQVHFSAEVSYNKGNYIGVINDLSKTVAEKTKSDENEDSDEEEQQGAVLAQKTVEGYTFDAITGEYVTKDSIIGKEYVKISELLYRIHSGFDYSAVMSGEYEFDSVPEDTDEVGKHFYDGASTLCEDGYVFFAVSDEGYAERVVIPYTVQGVFTQTY